MNSILRFVFDNTSSCAYPGFERRGLSRRLSYYALSGGCTRILFPGCALAATRPRETLKLFNHLRRSIPGLGIVRDCCTKPSHDLGCSGFFETTFGEMRRYLLENGVRRVLTACPSCHKIFRRHGGNLAVETVYEVLAAEKGPVRERGEQTVSIHDPCPLRFDDRLQSSVRTLVSPARAGIDCD